MKNNKGFTLIEMLVVVAIVGLLSAVAVVGVGSSRQKARDTRRISDIRQIQNMLEISYGQNNKYPDLLSGLTSPAPKDPLKNKDYGYKGSDQTYILGACLEAENQPVGSGVVAATDALPITNLDAACDCKDSGGTSKKIYCVKT